MRLSCALCIVERGIPRSAYRLVIDYCDDLEIDSSSSSHSLPLVANLQFLGSSFAKEYLLQSQKSFGGVPWPDLLEETASYVARRSVSLWTSVCPALASIRCLVA